MWRAFDECRNLILLDLMGLDYAAVFDAIRALARSEQAVGACMQSVISICEAMVRHKDWDRLRMLDYDGDVFDLRGWIGAAIEGDPPGSDVRGMWFGVVNRSDGGTVSTDMYFAGTPSYDPADPALLWTGGADYFPERRYAHSRSLLGIYNVATGGLGSDAEWPLCLCFAATAVRTLLRPVTSELLGPNLARVGLAVGYDEGDMFKLGELTTRGLVLDS